MKIINGTKYIWHVPTHDHTTILNTASSYNLAVPLAQTLLTRGYTTPEQINDYLFSLVDKDVFDPQLLKDAAKAVDRIEYAIKHQEKILIFGDYDVDGITSSSLMMSCLAPLQAHVNFYLPNRLREGYGLSCKVVERAASNGYKVIITVDNGTTAFEPALLAKKLGIDLIITDHHKPHHTLPEAFALVNPHQSTCAYPFKHFAGVGVTFKLLSLLYQRRGIPMPEKAYELLLLGTVADVVPLLGENRFWVRQGLQWVNNQESLSLKVLKANGKVTKTSLSSTDIGYRITPQINALGRLDDPREGVTFLLGNNPQETERIGAVLLRLNEARKDIERTIFEQVCEQIENGSVDLEKERIIIAASHDWPAGVIGLVASRIVGKYGRPTILLHLTKDGKAKGSCRSIRTFNIFEALQAAHHLLDQFGGHAVAAGLSLSVSNIRALKEILEEQAAEKLTVADLEQKVTCDAHLTLPEANKKLINDMAYFEPFGAENPEPLFYLENVSLIGEPQILKDVHVKCMIFDQGVIKPTIFFNRPDIIVSLQKQASASLNILAHISENTWQGRSSVELMGVDLAFKEHV